MENNQPIISAIALFCEKLAHLSEPQPIARLICETAEQAGLKDCVVYEANPNEGSLVQRAAIGQKLNSRGEIENPICLKFGQGIVGMVALFRKDIVIEDTSFTPNYVIDDCTRLSELTVPIVSGEQILGVIDSENEEKAFFNEFHHDLFQLMAVIVAPKLAMLAEQRNAATSKSLNTNEPVPIHLKRISKDIATNYETYKRQISDLLSTLDLPEFNRIVNGLLKNYHKPNALSDLPTLKQLLSEYQNKNFSSFFIDSLKSAIRDACDELFLPTPKTQKLHYIIEHTYLNPLANHQAVADHLGMSYSTFNRHLGNARKEISSFLWVKLHKQNNLALRAS